MKDLLSIEYLKSMEFSGFIPLNEIHKSSINIPDSEGVIVLYKNSDFSFDLDKSKQNLYKEYSSEFLFQEIKSKLIEDANLLFIETVKNLKGFASFLLDGPSQNRKHSKGVGLIWDLHNFQNLLVAWLPIKQNWQGEEIKEKILAEFYEQFGRHPFAETITPSLKKDYYLRGSSNKNIRPIPIEEHIENFYFSTFARYNPSEIDLIVFLCYLYLKILADDQSYSQYKNISNELRSIRNSISHRRDTLEISEFHRMINKLTSFIELGLPFPNLSVVNTNLFESIILHFSELSFKPGSVDRTKLGNSISKLIQRFYNEKLHSVNISVSDEISKLMIDLLDIKENDSIYDPHFGVNHFLSEIFYRKSCIEGVSIQLFGKDENYIHYVLLKLNLLLFDNIEFDIQISTDNGNNTSVNQFNKKFGKIITALPTRKLKSTSEMQYRNIIDLRNPIDPVFLQTSSIKEILNSLKSNGKAVLLTSSQFILSHDKNLKKIRKYLIENDLIDSIIQLSLKMFKDPSPNVSIVVLNKRKDKKKKGKILFIKSDLKKDFSLNEMSILCKGFNEVSGLSKIIDNDIIKSSNYSLNPSTYDDSNLKLQLQLKQKEAIRLNNTDFFTIKGGLTQRNLEPSDDGVPFLRIGNLAENINDMFPNYDEISKVRLKDLRNKLDTPALLIAMVGNKIKPTRFDPEPGLFDDFSSVTFHSNILAIIPNQDRIKLTYLYYKFFDNEIKRQLDQIRMSSTIPRISLSSIKNLIIPIVSLEEQDRYVNSIISQLDQEQELEYSDKLDRIKFLSSQKIPEYIDEMESEDKLSEKDDLGEKTIRLFSHNLLPKLSDSIMTINKIKKYLNNKNLLSDTIYNEDQETEYDDIDLEEESPNKFYSEDLSKTIDRLLGYLSTASNIVVDAKKSILLRLDDKDFSEYFLKDLLDEIIQIKKAELSGRVDFSLLGDDDKMIVLLHRDTFIEAINQLINNSIKHGFQGADITNPKIIIEFNGDKADKLLHIVFSNNGRKFDLSSEQYFGMGLKGVNSSGQGLGGFFVKRVFEEHGGTANIVDSDSGFKLKMTLVNWYPSI
jgi:type I restriction-modification system DNA methylase subunit